MEVRTTYLKSIQETVRSARPEVLRGLREFFDKSILQHAEDLKREHPEVQEIELAKARADEAARAEEAQQHLEEYTEIRSQLKKAPGGSRILGSCYLALGAGCCLCELALNDILPRLLGVGSAVTGVAVSVAPSLAAFVFDLIFAAVGFSVELVAPAGSWLRKAFWAVLAVLNLACVLVLSYTRSIAGVIDNGPAGADFTPFQQAMISASGQLVALAVALNAALFLGVAGLHLSRASAKRKALLRAQKMEVHQKELDELQRTSQKRRIELEVLSRNAVDDATGLAASWILEIRLEIEMRIMTHEIQERQAIAEKEEREKAAMQALNPADLLDWKVQEMLRAHAFRGVN